MLEIGRSLLRKAFIICLLMALKVEITFEEEGSEPPNNEGDQPPTSFGGMETRLVETPNGKIRGEVFLLADGSTGVRYLGIPYALPPVGERRFRKPEPVPPWENTLDAMRFGPICFQPLESDVWDMEASDADMEGIRTNTQEDFKIDPQSTIGPDDQKRLQVKLRNQIHEVEDLMSEIKRKKLLGNSSQEQSNVVRDGNPGPNSEEVATEQGREEERQCEDNPETDRLIRSLQPHFFVNKTHPRPCARKTGSTNNETPNRSFLPYENPQATKTERRRRHSRGTKKNEPFKKQKNGRLYLKQKYLRDYSMSEDCLTLNIYTPLISSRRVHKVSSPPDDDSHHLNRYPVVVYVHGGSYYCNSGRLYPGERLAAEGVIVVTLNYRLGPFGFLSTGDNEAKGNWGLHDQLLALKWLNQHIPFFGGDTNKVLLTGNSAGASSVILIMLSPLSKGLFTRVAALSGCALAPWSLQQNPLKGARKLGAGLKCPVDSTKELIKCLKTKKPEEINKEFADNVIEDGLWLSFAPVVESNVPQAFLPSDPRELLTKGKFHKVPLLMSLTQDEVTIWFQNKPRTMKKLDVEEWMNNIIKQIYTKLDNLSLSAVSHAIRSLYIYSEGYSPSDLSIVQEKPHSKDPSTRHVEVPVKMVANLFSDIGLRVPCMEEARILSDWTPTYLAEFTYASKDDVRVGNQKWIGSYHESDLQYIFGQPMLGLQNSLRHEHDKAVSHLIMHVIKSFASTGIPSIKSKKNLTWPKFNGKTNLHLEINESPQLRQGLMQSKLYFWQHFLPLLVKWPVQLLPSSAPVLTLSLRLLVVIFALHCLCLYQLRSYCLIGLTMNS